MFESSECVAGKLGGFFPDSSGVLHLVAVWGTFGAESNSQVVKGSILFGLGVSVSRSVGDGMATGVYTVSALFVDRNSGEVREADLQHKAVEEWATTLQMLQFGLRSPASIWKIPKICYIQFSEELTLHLARWLRVGQSLCCP